MNRFCCGALVAYLWLSGFSVSIPAVWGAQAPVFSKVVRFSGLFPCELVCDNEKSLIIAQPGVMQAPMTVTKLNASGGVVWTKSFPGDCTECHALAVDSQNNILVTGYISGSATFGSTTLSTAGPKNWDMDLFVLKLDRNGNVMWVRQAAGGAEPCTAAGMAIGADPTGNVYVGGSFGKVFDFGRIRLDSRSASNAGDGFLAKWSATGDTLWAARLGESAVQASGSLAMESQAQGQPSPRNASSLVVGPRGECRLHCGAQLWMYRADGAFVSAVYSPASSSTAASSGGTALDADGNCYVTGDHGNAAGLCKVNPQGQVLWSKSLGVSGSGNASGYDVTVDRGGNAIIAGQFKGTLQAGDTALPSAGNFDIFVAAFSPNGDLLWATTAGGPGNDMCRGVTANYDGKVWIAGTYGAQYGSGSHAATFGDISLPAPTDDKKVYVAALASKGGGQRRGRALVQVASTRHWRTSSDQACLLTGFVERR